jgi:mRNA-degrading endonuclease toxin of MazEF toxin-antitoxin module
MFGEIFICEFPFSSGLQTKVRPVLVLFDLGNDAVVSRVTSAFHNGPLDIPIQDWRSAGLLHDSIVRLNRIVTAEKSIFLRRLGRLSPKDCEAVRSAWNKHMRL